VAVARALINIPKILFCDEPTGNLDTNTGLQIKSLLWQLNRDFNTTLVVVTHDNELVKDATRIINLKDGVILN
jgi:predicted ABC-type transport system involved in lysophospholipase L1 biosynthesis ATPase subunit